MVQLRDRLVMFKAAVIALIIGSHAYASYQGVTVTLHTSVTTPGGDMSVYRVYALFTDPGDYLIAVAGSPTIGNLVIRNLNANASGLGAGFYNPAGTNREPVLQPGDPEEFQWETFVTIGGPYFDGAYPTSLSPGFPSFINGTELNTNNAGWYQTFHTLGTAGNGVLNPSGAHPGMWGVTMMQLTVNAGEHVAGTVAVTGVNAIPLAGATTFQTGADQTFSSFPAPGGLAVLALAGVMGSRGRRIQ